MFYLVVYIYLLLHYTEYEFVHLLLISIKKTGVFKTLKHF